MPARVSLLHDDIAVLHVDDNQAFLDLAAEFLERAEADLTVLSESNPVAALRTIETEDVDCVVCDYNMPDMDGITLCEKIRERAPGLPVVLFTSQDDQELVERALEAGASDFVNKTSGTHQYTLLANRIVLLVTRRRALDLVEAADMRRST